METLRCSFCDKSEAEVGYLLKGAQAQICESCIGVAHAILEDKMSGTSQKKAGAKIDISRYNIDYKLASLLKAETLSKYRFIPLDLYRDRIVLALADIGLASDIANELKSTLKNEPIYSNKQLELNVLLATESEVKKKIRAFVEWRNKRP